MLLSQFLFYWIISNFDLATHLLLFLIISLEIQFKFNIFNKRLYVVWRPFDVIKVTKTRAIYIVITCVFLGQVWAILPIFGWSHYNLEGLNTSCSIEWSRERSLNIISFNITLLIFGYIVPMSVVVFANMILIYLVKN